MMQYDVAEEVNESGQSILNMMDNGQQEEVIHWSYQDTNGPSGQQKTPEEIEIENEPPLLEDLGIDKESIISNFKAVLFFKKFEEKFASNPDMIGPLAICFLLAMILSL